MDLQEWFLMRKKGSLFYDEVAGLDWTCIEKCLSKLRKDVSLFYLSP